MSSSTLSAVIEKLIRSLCLNDFPGGNGTWVSILNTDLSINTLESKTLKTWIQSAEKHQRECGASRDGVHGCSPGSAELPSFSMAP